MYEIVRDQLSDLALGVTFLGTGGGGEPYAACLMVNELLRNGTKIKIVDPCELADDDLVAPIAMVGAPTVACEKLPSANAGRNALRKLEALRSQGATAVIASEIGGSNGVFPMYVAGQAGIPVVDGDGMGRAFPESQMVTFNLFGVRAAPTVVADEYGATLVIDGQDPEHLERLVRAAVTAMGGEGCVVDYPMTGREIRRSALPGSVSLALNIGRTVRNALHSRRDPFDALSHFFISNDGRKFADVIFSGKVVDIARQTHGGFVFGKARIRCDADRQRVMEIRLKNEYLAAEINGEPVATVPDLICILDRYTASPIATESLRYGQRVVVFAVSAPDVFLTPKALSVVGPQAFGLDFPYVPLGLRASSASPTTPAERPETLTK